MTDKELKLECLKLAAQANPSASEENIVKAAEKLYAFINKY